MENIHASNMFDITHIDVNKTTTSFIKDAPKISRYTVRSFEKSHKTIIKSVMLLILKIALMSYEFNVAHYSISH